MKVFNFLFNYLNIPLLPDNKRTIRIFSFLLNFYFFHKIFYKYLNICLNKKKNQKVIFAVKKFAFNKKLPIYIYEIYLQALRNLSLNSKSIIIALEILKLFPDSDVGYWHLVHSYLAYGKVNDALKIIDLFKTRNIYSERFNNMSLGNKYLNKLICSSDINMSSDYFHLFFNDSGWIGQALLTVKIQKTKLKSQSFALFLTNHAGFSNTIVALINSIGLAKLLKLKEVFVLKTNFISSLLLNNLLVDGVRIRVEEKLPARNYLVGNFFSHFNFIKFQDKKFSAKRLDYASTILGNYVDNKIEFKDDLVIHIRSGDIFKSRSIHPNYGQPPLSFYILVILFMNPSSIRIIFEDFSNPVIKLLIKYVKSLKCTLNIQDCNSLRNDVNCIFRAKNVVCGNGTFVPGILLGSNAIDSIFIFESSKDFKSRWSLERVKKIYNVIDNDGFYRKNILNKNWRASTNQLRLMKNYPITNLKIKLTKF